MLKENDERAFWLDQRFENNPGFLADEGAALGLIPSATPVAAAPAIAPATNLHCYLA